MRCKVNECIITNAFSTYLAIGWCLIQMHCNAFSTNQGIPLSFLPSIFQCFCRMNLSSKYFLTSFFHFSMCYLCKSDLIDRNMYEIPSISRRRIYHPCCLWYHQFIIVFSFFFSYVRSFRKTGYFIVSAFYRPQDGACHVVFSSVIGAKDS